MSSLDYLRNSLADSTRMSIQPSDNNSYSFSFDVLKAGRIDTETTLKLFDKYGKRSPPSKQSSTPNQASGSDPDLKQVESAFLHVLVLPLKYKHIIEHGKGKRSGSAFLYPLYLPAILSKEGKLFGGRY